MKTVFSNSNETIHVFAQQDQQEGKSQSGNVFFNGAKIYSYGYHYLLGEFLDKDTILINDRGYSVTTSKHIWQLGAATSHKKRFYVTQTDLDLVYNTVKYNLSKIPNARVNRKNYLDGIVSLFRSLNEYLEYTKTKTKASKLKEYKEIKKIVQRLETDKDAIILEAANLNKKKAEVIKQKALKELENQKEKIKLWKNNETNNLWNSKYYWEKKPTLLRLSLNNAHVETSKGVKIEVKTANLLYKLIEAGKDINGYKIDNYTVIGIKDNTLKIGCHDIPLQEVNEIGKQLNKLQTTLN